MLPRYKPTYSSSDILEALMLTVSEMDVEGALRSALADIYQIKHVFLFSMAREALSTLLVAYNKPGDVLVPAYNCIAVPEAIRFAGYNPSFVDIDLRTLNFQLNELAKKVDSKSRAVLITHQFGIPSEINSLLELCDKHNLLAIEDAAPAFGAGYYNQWVGTYGDAAILSFEKTKVFSGMGGGVLLTNDDELAGRVERNLALLLNPNPILEDFMKSLVHTVSARERLHSGFLLLYRLIKKETLYEIASVNKVARHPRRMSKFQAGLVLVQLKRRTQILRRKRKIAGYYSERLISDTRCVLPSVPVGASPAWSQFPIMVEDKEATFWKMRSLGVDLNWNYKYSCPESYGIGGFPNSHIAARSVLGLPIYPSLQEKELAEVCEKLIRQLN
jgi:dTDP-4-amino-4,6-dideoxygalactose transaminase